MHIDAVGAFLIVVSNVVFWTLIFLGKSFTPLARSYFGWAFFITLWAFGYGITLSGLLPYEPTLVWNKYCQAMATMIGPFFFKFSCDVAGRYEENKKIFRLYLYFGIINAIGLFFTPYYVKSLWSFGPYTYQPLGGPLYIVFTLFFMWCTLHSYIVVALQYKKAAGIRKTHMTLFLIATGIAYFGGGTLFFQGFKLPVPTTGVYLILAYVLIIGYSIYRYKFMDIEVLVKRTLVFAGLASFVFGVFALVTFFVQNVASLYLPVGRWSITLVSVLLIVLAYEPIRNLLIDLTDRYLFQKKFDYRRLLREASREMTAIKSLKRLARVVVGFLIVKARIKNAATFVYAMADHAYLLQASRPLLRDHERQFLAESHPLVRELKMRQGPFDKESLEDELGKISSPERKRELTVCVDTLERLKTEAVIPSFLYLAEHQKQSHSFSGPVLRSILFLGPKKSDEPYSQEDLDVFHTLAQESAIAVENARLYDEGIQKTKENVALKLQLVRKQTLANLAGSVAHEIKGPVQRTSYATYLIRKKGLLKLEEMLKNSTDLEGREKRLREMSESIAKYLTEIDEANSRQLTTATTIARFSKMERTNFGEMKAEDIHEEAFEKDQVDVYMILNLTAEKAKIEYQGRDDYMVEIDSSELSHHLPPVKMNQDMLEQVVINLLLNAYDAMKGREMKKITITANIDSAEKEFMHVVVQDTGAGIPNEIKEKVWEPDFTTKGKKGTGMGLYLCRLLVEKIHHGRIWAEFADGAGTAFHLMMPIWKEKPLTEKQEAANTDE